MQEPRIIQFDKIGDSSLGYISIAEVSHQIPFDIKRVYWTYFTPNEVQRGYHAHKKLNQVIVAVSGVIKFQLKDQSGNSKEYVLDDPSKGLYIPQLYWREISFSHNAVLLCLASEVFSEKDYIRKYEDFISYGKENEKP
jgi:dTDP-4-dehydrorhamnose 3,5-epimerase-like enzyme